MDRRVNYLLQIINKRQQSSPAIFRKLTKNKKREIWLKLRILVHCDYGDDHREIWKSNVGCMSPTRDTGLFIMSESLLKNALGANHQDINGKRSTPPPFQLLWSGCGNQQRLIPRTPCREDPTKAAKLGQLFDMRTEPILLPIHTYSALFVSPLLVVCWILIVPFLLRILNHFLII